MCISWYNIKKNNHPNGVKPTMKEFKLRSSVNWQKLKTIAWCTVASFSDLSSSHITRVKITSQCIQRCVSSSSTKRLGGINFRGERKLPGSCVSLHTTPRTNTQSSDSYLHLRFVRPCIIVQFK